VPAVLNGTELTRHVSSKSALHYYRRLGHTFSLSFVIALNWPYKLSDCQSLISF